MADSHDNLAAEMIAAVEAEMRLILTVDAESPGEFAGMLLYHMGWMDEALRPTLANAGKRIRPLLLLLACDSAGGNWRQAVPAAADVEILHNFTLIHDDIQDNSPTRRGRPTVWKLWGVPLAINAGDAMFALAHLAVVRLLDHDVPAAIVVQALRRLDETCLDLTRGQYADMRFETRSAVQVEEYLDMIRGKTAALLALCAELGALIAGRDGIVVGHYADFALHLGLAFQVRDDILGIWGDEDRIGKSAATDIVTRKKSLPVLYGLTHSPALQALYASDAAGEAFVAEAIRLLEEVSAHRFAEAREQAYTEAALSHLQTVSADSGSPLNALAEQLLGRTY
jgi:geranylgeranyl diphosphate synthase type I